MIDLFFEPLIKILFDEFSILILRRIFVHLRSLILPEVVDKFGLGILLSGIDNGMRAPVQRGSMFLRAF